jgi:sec-independent protein translocase protein TatA
MHISVTQWFIILVIVIALFGTKKLRNLGEDLGGAIKSFRASIKESEEIKMHTKNEAEPIEGEVISMKIDKV